MSLSQEGEINSILEGEGDVLVFLPKSGVDCGTDYKLLTEKSVKLTNTKALMVPKYNLNVIPEELNIFSWLNLTTMKQRSVQRKKKYYQRKMQKDFSVAERRENPCWIKQLKAKCSA